MYCLNVRTIHRKIETLWKTFKEGKRRYLEKRTGAAVDKYKKIVGDAQKLFDVHADVIGDDEEQCKKQWGVSMTQRERLYYQDMKGERRMECDHAVDPVWYTAMIRKQRQRELCETYKDKHREYFRTVDIDKINEILDEVGGLLNQDEPESNSEDEGMQERVPESEPGPSVGKRKKRKFVLEETDDCEGMPKRFCHLRDSERMVCDDVYLTCANLLGRGLLIDETADATVIVGKGMFKRPWKTPNESKDSIDVNKMPLEHSR